jgi:hypothetical protein
MSTLTLKVDLREMEQRLDAKFVQFEQRMDAKFIQFEQRMVIKLGTMMVVAVGAVATLVKLL